MAHAPVAMTDLPLALTLGIVAAATALAISTWHWRWIGILGLSLALALGAKHSALPGLLGAGAIGVVAALVSAWRRGWRVGLGRLGKIALAGILGWLLLWAQYGGRFHASPDGTDPFNMAMSKKVAGLRDGTAKGAIALADRWRVLPRSYLWGLAERCARAWRGAIFTISSSANGMSGARRFIFGPV